MPAFDRRDALGSMRRLERSPTPQARAIARQIANGPRDLALQRAAARREGLPLTPVELEAGAPPDSLNAAPVYTRLMRILKARPLDARASGIALRLGLDGTATAEESAAVRKLLAERRDVMDLVLQATDRPRCVFRHDWSHGPPILLDEFAALRMAARLLTAQSYLLAEYGRWPEAVALQTRGFRIAEHEAAGSFLIGYLVAMHVERMTLSGFQNLLYRAGPDATVAEAVRHAVAASRPRLEIRRALPGEMLFGRVSLEELRRQGPAKLEEWLSMHTGLEEDGTPRRPPAKPRKLTPAERELWNRFIDAAEAAYLRRMRRVMASAGAPYPAGRAFLQRQVAEDKAEPGNPIRWLTSGWLPVILSTEIRAMQLRAQEAAVIAGAALLADRSRRGAFPDRLEEALPTPPPDPFTGRSLRYRREGDGFVVFSVGPDGTFDGGPAGARIGGRESLFRYPAPMAPAFGHPSSPTAGGEGPNK